MENQGYILEEGTVALLDVLGWKGIWQREENPISLLEDLIDSAIVYNSKSTSIFSKSIETVHPKVEILSISDTIAIMCHGDISISLNPILYVAGLLVAKSILKKIPLRGAISYGKLTHKKNIILGPAIDEVASWYENHDQIGCILAPSVSLRLKQQDINTTIDITEGKSIELLAPEIPLKCKNGYLSVTQLINWPLLYASPVIQRDLDYSNYAELKKRFISALESLGPFYPNTAVKIFSALDCFCSHEDRIKELIDDATNIKGDGLDE